MPKATIYLMLLVFVVCLFGVVQAQDSIAFKKALLPPDPAFSALEKKSLQIESKLGHKSSQYLNNFQQEESRLYKKLSKRDSLLAKHLFEGAQDKYSQLRKAPENLDKYASVYSGHLDSLMTSLTFLKENNFCNPTELQKSLERLNSLQEKLNQADQIKKYVQERGKILMEQLERLGMLKELKSFQKQAYYYSAQVNEYRQRFEDPSKVEEKLLEVVQKLPQFKEFFQKNSQLSSLFSLSGGSTPTSSAALAGLQTRASMNQVLVERFGTAPNTSQLLQQNLQAAQGQLNQLKSKVSQYGTGSYSNSSSDMEPSKGFKPNTQKTKCFIDRLEYVANVQTGRGSAYFPVTSDLALSLGYKLNDKSSIGVGASYKMGWGTSWKDIRITHQGVGLRSYVDYKLKGSLYISGGYEQNCRNQIHSIQQLKDQSLWQASGLVGLSKKYKAGKLKGDVKLLWDFLSYRQVPRAQAVVFRVGYSLK